MRMTVTGAVASLVVVASLAVAPAAMAAPGDRATDVAEHWTPERVAAAEPRDLLVDDRGLGYQRHGNGRLTPHGHNTAAEIPAPTAVPSANRSEPAPTPRAKPVADTAGPSVSNMLPDGTTMLGTSVSFSATVTDTSGVRSATFVVTDSTNRSSSFAAAASGTTWRVELTGFTPGAWKWSVRATDTRGNVTTTPTVAFSVGQPPPPPTSDSTLVANDFYEGGGAVQTAAGRIYFEMPDAKNLRTWSGYVCSGTVVADGLTGQSVILTAAHCVYDDVNKVFARNVLFIPNQGATTGTGTDTDCTNDQLGCWTPSFGVVDTDWTTSTFPNNIEWDYAYYVVPDGSHRGARPDLNSLESAVGTLPVSFATPLVNLSGDPADGTTALGYSYSDDPNFMFCSEDMTTEGTANWWLPNCGLSGGASGGPWVQPLANGSGPVISVNSWGYTDQPGMAGPKLAGTSAEALFEAINAGQGPTTAWGAALNK